MGDVQEYIDYYSIQHVAEALKPHAINRLLCQPELTEYRIDWYSKHGAAWFTVKKASTERAGAPKTSRRYNTEEVQGEVAGGVSHDPTSTSRVS